MTHLFTKMKGKQEVSIYKNKHARGRHKGKGYTIATMLRLCLFLQSVDLVSWACSATAGI